MHKLVCVFDTSFFCCLANLRQPCMKRAKLFTLAHADHILPHKLYFMHWNNDFRHAFKAFFTSSLKWEKCMPVDICGKRIYFLCDLKMYPFSLLYGLMPNYIIIFVKSLEWCDVISIHSYLLSCVLCSENSCRISVIIYSLFSIQNTLPPL